MAYEKITWINNSTPALDADNLNRIEDGIDESVKKAGDTMTGDLILSGNPTSDNMASNKKYVDSYIAVGSYVGDGSLTRTIPLDFTPKAVWVYPRNGLPTLNRLIYGGLAVTDSPTAIEVVSGGFNVFYFRASGSYTHMTNENGEQYNYIAFR